MTDPIILEAFEDLAWFITGTMTLLLILAIAHAYNSKP